MITLRTIQPDEADDAITVMDLVFQELWHVGYDRVKGRYDDFEDMDDIDSYYFQNNGTFMVLEDDGKIIGTGGIGSLDEMTAELKRIWLLKEYRGKGLGRKLVTSLLDFARSHGYQRVELTVASPALQIEAVGLYGSLGFVPVNDPTGEGERLLMRKRFTEK